MAQESCDKVEVVYLGMVLLTATVEGTIKVSQPSLLPALHKVVRQGGEGRCLLGRPNKELALHSMAGCIVGRWPGAYRYDSKTFYMTVLYNGRVERYRVRYKTTGLAIGKSMDVREVRFSKPEGYAVLRPALARLAKLLLATSEKVRLLSQYMSVLSVRDLVQEGSHTAAPTVINKEKQHEQLS